MDINEEAEKSLKKTGVNVVFQYPQSFSVLPIISFYTLDERGTAAYDNREYFRDGTINADIWAKSPSETGLIYRKVCEVLKNDGWSEVLAADVPRGGKNIYHRAVQFVKSFYIE